MVIAVASFWMLHDYPGTAKFLKPAERRFVQDRLLLDADGCSSEFKWKFAKDALLDWKIWAVGSRSIAFANGLVRRHVPGRFDASLLLLLVFPYSHCEPRLHGSDGATGKLSPMHFR